MADFNDWYTETTLLKGDECSRALAEITAPTLKNHPDIRFVKSGMNHLAVIQPRENKEYVGFSLGGPSDEKDIRVYAKNLVSKAVQMARDNYLTPIGFANVIDANRADPELAKIIGEALVEESKKYGLAILNGEYADLGNRVTVDANMNLTMISYSDISRLNRLAPNTREKIIIDGTTYVRFNPNGELIYVNSDGVGTKHELYERSGFLHCALQDSLAMKLDDLVKINARLVTVHDVLEHNGFISPALERMFRMNLAHVMTSIDKLVNLYSNNAEFNEGAIDFHNVGSRIQSFNNSRAYNISGSAISLISEDKLKNLPKPMVGNYMIALQKFINGHEIDGPRSNGISLLRRIPKDAYGDNWHTTKEGQEILKFATTPSDIFYPLFKQVLDEDVANFVMHLSGGAYDAKLSRQIAKENLHVNLTSDQSDPQHLWPVSDMVKRLIDLSGMPPSSFYNKWPMSNPGFIFTDSPETIIDIAAKHGYRAKIAGRLEQADGLKIKSGVSIRTYDGSDIFFDGK